jgi:hypothetical protein
VAFVYNYYTLIAYDSCEVRNEYYILHIRNWILKGSSVYEITSKRDVWKKVNAFLSENSFSVARSLAVCIKSMCNVTCFFDVMPFNSVQKYSLFREFLRLCPCKI